MVQQCRRRGIRVAAVTKLFCGHPVIAAELTAGGVDLLADSRIRNLKRLGHFPLPKMLLRVPMISQSADIVTYSDIALVSEPKTIQALSNEALRQGKRYQVILMIDLGDLREGIFHEQEIHAAVKSVLGMPSIHLLGIGTNLTCYGGVKPSRENLMRLVNLRKDLENTYDIILEVISGGNGSTLSLFPSGDIPAEINQLRLGSSLTMGIGLNDEPIDGLYHDAFMLEAEITEIREKPSVPIGEIGLDAFGNTPVFVDKGMRMRAICAVGRQDVHPDHLKPIDSCIQILGASSDHLILDITDSASKLAVGDTVSFHLAYGGCLSAMTSEYVHKHFVRA
jgi:predicted amino acid racemase